MRAEDYKRRALARLISERDSYTRDSAWRKGVRQYAIDMLEGTDGVPDDGQTVVAWLKSGAGSWNDYSYGGCALIRDEDIAKRLCTPSELKRKRNGELPPNSRESWLDVQGRACCQAAVMILNRWH